MGIKTLFSEQQIKSRVVELAKQIRRDYDGEELVIVCVLNGAFIFCADLIREVNESIYVDFIKASSYGDNKVSSGNLRVEMDLKVSIEGKHVLIVEDIVDTGLTLSCLIEKLKARNPASLKLASFLHKPSQTKYSVNIDYLGFEIDNLFVVGYGLDYAGKYRELPFVGVLE